jgi:hypothetical protein
MPDTTDYESGLLEGWLAAALQALPMVESSPLADETQLGPNEFRARLDELKNWERPKWFACDGSRHFDIALGRWWHEKRCVHVESATELTLERQLCLAAAKIGRWSLSYREADDPAAKKQIAYGRAWQKVSFLNDTPSAEVEFAVEESWRDYKHEACDGEGRICCDHCDGRGSLPCEHCSGHGETYSSCKACKGKGTRTNGQCSKCNGEGEIPRRCSVCDGKPQDFDPCTNCGETGQVDCSCNAGLIKGYLIARFAIEETNRSAWSDEPEGEETGDNESAGPIQDRINLGPSAESDESGPPLTVELRDAVTNAIGILEKSLVELEKPEKATLHKYFPDRTGIALMRVLACSVSISQPVAHTDYKYRARLRSRFENRLLVVEAGSNKIVKWDDRPARRMLRDW